MAIGKHEHTRNLYRILASALRANDDERASETLRSITAVDGLLALEMLAFMAERLGETGGKEQAIRCFELQMLLTDITGLTRNKAITQHQLGLFLLRQNDISSAEDAFKQAAVGFRQTAPDLFKITNALRAQIYSIQLLSNPEAKLPSDLSGFLKTDSLSAARVALAHAELALGKSNMKGAEEFLLQAKSLCGDRESLRNELLLLEARLMRRKGQLEKADYLRREAASLIPYQQQSDEIKWEAFYFARDSGQYDRAKRLLADLRDGNPIKHTYQRASIALKEKDSETARSLFLECLQSADDDLLLANCYGMLALVAETYAQSLAYLYRAIGLYVKLGQTLDHAICLRDLAIIEMEEGLEWQKRGVPQIAISQFPRAAGHLSKALEMAESLGADDFCVELQINQGRLEVARGRYMIAYNNFEKARVHLELIYLRIANPELFTRYANRYTSCCIAAVAAALRAENVVLAFAASERAKARRMLRDISESWLAVAMADSGGSSVAEELVLNAILPIRKKILEQRPLSAGERRELDEAEDSLRRLAPELATVEVMGKNLEYINEPLGLDRVRRIVFEDELKGGGSELVQPGALNQSVPQELPGGGIIECKKCGVPNKIGASFCSACEGILPRSASANLLTGGSSEEEAKVAFAEHLYNNAIQRFADADFRGAEELFVRAMEYHSHPDYYFFHGMCRLAGGDPEEALRDFYRIKELQFAGKYPFWPLPVSPSELATNVQALEKGDTSPEQVFKDLILAHYRFLARRREGKSTGADL
jgi:tetratricopeptide (TPR) repeat protein